MAEYKNLICVIVYTREDNIKRWLQCWERSDTKDSQLMVIHNQDDLSVVSPLKQLCEKAGVIYQPRQNIGMDIGALKDICTNTINHPEFDYLLWFTDDVLPIRPSFITEFVNRAKSGVSYYRIYEDKNYQAHIRSVAFCLKKEVIDKLVFKDYITKSDCYGFEFGDRKTCLYCQMVKLGIDLSNNEPYNISSVWDTNHDAGLRRWEEQRKNFRFTQALGTSPSPFINKKNFRPSTNRSIIRF